MDKARGAILRVDDDQAVRSIVGRGTQGAGYEGTRAAGAKAALEKAGSQDFNVVSRAIEMSGQSEMEVLGQIVDNLPNACVIMITAVVDTGTAADAMKLRAYEYVTRPSNPDDLSMRVEKALERKRLIGRKGERQPRLPNAAS